MPVIQKVKVGSVGSDWNCRLWGLGMVTAQLYILCAKTRES